MPTFGADASHFIEVPDDANPGQTKRPDSGFEVKVRNAVTLAALDDLVTVDYGYFDAYTTPADVHRIQLSTDGGSNWTKKLTSEELLDALAEDMPDLDDFLGSADAAADASAASAASAAAAVVNAAAAAAAAQATLDAASRITSGAPGEPGAPGATGAPGPVMTQAVWEGIPAEAQYAADDYEAAYDTLIHPVFVSKLAQANASAIDVIIRGSVNGAEVFDATPLTMSNGQDYDEVTLPDAIQLFQDGSGPNGHDVFQLYIEQMGPDTGGASASPTPLAAVGKYVSGVSGAPSSATSWVVPLPAGWAIGTQLELKVIGSAQPASVGSSTWSQVGVPVTDNLTQLIHTTYQRTAQLGEGSATVTFSASAGGCAYIVGINGVNTSDPIDASSGSNINSPGTQTASSPSLTTDLVTPHETYIVTYGTRFNPTSSGGPTPVNPSIDAALTLLDHDVTARASTSPNFGITVAYKTVAAAHTTVPAYTADLGSGVAARWTITDKTLKPSAASAPGTDPRVQFYMTVYPDGFPA